MRRLFNLIPALLILGATGTALAQRRQPPRDPGHGGGRNEVFVISCGSTDYRYNTCAVDGEIMDARVVRQQSRAYCDLGRTWGYDRNYIWVDRGCRAEFEVRVRPRGGAQRLDCYSRNRDYTTCYAGGRIRGARLIRQASRAECIEGDTWGYDRDYIWVDYGCGGTFDVFTEGGRRRVVPKK